MSLTFINIGSAQDYSTGATGQNENVPTEKERTQSDESSENASETSSASYSKAQINNSMASAQKAMLMAKLPPPNRRESDASSTKKPSSKRDPIGANYRSGISVNIADVQKVLSSDGKGQRAANQSIRVAYSIESNGTNQSLTTEELQARSERDKALRLTDEKGRLTLLGEQFQKLPNDGRAIITEPSTTPYQLVILVNGSQPSPEKAAVIISGLVSKGMVTISTDSNGQYRLNVQPYKVASANNIINAGYENEAQLNNIKAILPGLKGIEALGILAASTYGGAAIATLAAPLGPVAAGALSSTGGKNIETVLKEKRLATIQENFESALIGGLSGGLSTIGSNNEIIEIGLSASTKARITVLPAASSITSIFNGKVARTESVAGIEGNIARDVGGLRRSPSIVLNEEEIAALKREFEEIGGDASILRFNQGKRTGYIDEADKINVRGDILPVENATHPRSVMSSKAALAHELGHRANRGTQLPLGAWNDEFRASYWAAKNAPNLSDQERVHLIQDAITRAQEACVRIEINESMRKILYGF